MNKRIGFLDGLRGLAILLVIGCHAYSRWPELVSYGDRFADFPLFKIGGSAGVQLFFLISGFVILMTLEKSRTPIEFMLKRWLRLFPAMLICTIFIFATASYFFERPAGNPPLISVLPGLSFIGPDWWLRIIKVYPEPIEGAFWTLFVEVRFYLFAALFFALGGRKGLMLALFLAFGSYVVLKYSASPLVEFGLIYSLNKVAALASLKFFGWFAAGAALYIYFLNSSVRWYFAGFGFALASILAEYSSADYDIAVASLSVLAIFMVALKSATLQQLLQNKHLVFVGYISYPLYLLHENLMISMVIKLGQAQSFIPQVLLPVLPLLAIMAVAYVIAQYGEEIIRRQLRRLLFMVGLLRPPHKSPALAT